MKKQSFALHLQTILLLSLFAFAAVALSAGTVRADDSCSHNWEKDGDPWYEVIGNNDSVHYLVQGYSCSICGEYKDERTEEAHSYGAASDPFNYTEVSASLHSYDITYDCQKCGHTKTETKTEAHSYYEPDIGNYDKISDTQHTYTATYYCMDCSNSKEEKVTENHKWEKSGSPDDFKSISSKKHSAKQDYYCSKCPAEKTVTVKLNHSFTKYGVCKDCEYKKGGTVTLKAGKTAYVNNKKWMKIVVKKNGYLIFKSPDKTAYDLYFYNKSKKIYVNMNVYVDGFSTSWERNSQNYVPVLKGTYFMKMKGADYGAVRYTWKKAPAASNYTKKKAYTLKKNKTAMGVIYSSAKKKTWTRWYKIKLTKKQYLRFNCAGAGYMLTDSKGNYIPTSSDYNNKKEYVGEISDKKLAKGTYYICLIDRWSSLTKKRTTGDVFFVKWH